MALPRSCTNLHCHRAFDLKPSTILKVLQKVDAFRRPERFKKFLLACEADARGRTGFEDRDYPQADYFERAWKEAGQVTADQVADADASGAEIGAEIDKMRLQAIKAVKAETANQVP